MKTRSFMARPAITTARKATRWEVNAFFYVRLTLVLTAFIFMAIMYRAAVLLRSSRPGFSFLSYVVTHLIAIVLSVILWVFIAKSAVQLKSYTRLTGRSPDGQALDYIANALILAALYATAFSMASTFKTLFLHTHYLGGVTTVTNLMPLMIILLATIFLLVGSERLKSILGLEWRKLSKRILALALCLYMLFVFAYAMYFYGVAPKLVDDDGLKHFALGPGTLLAVYVLPYALVWLFGLLACLNLVRYGRHIEGVIYRPLFRDLYVGLMICFVGTYLVQLFYVSNVSTNRFGPGLVILICLLLLLIRGCRLIDRGTNQLYKLEA